MDDVMVKSANLIRFFLSSSFNSCRCGLHNLMPKLYFCVVWARIYLIGPSGVSEPDVTKLFSHLKQTIFHLRSGNHCWTWQLMVAFEIWAIKLRPKGLRHYETMTVLVKLGEN